MVPIGLYPELEHRFPVHGSRRFPGGEHIKLSLPVAPQRTILGTCERKQRCKGTERTFSKHSFLFSFSTKNGATCRFRPVAATKQR